LPAGHEEEVATEATGSSYHLDDVRYQNNAFYLRKQRKLRSFPWSNGRKTSTRSVGKIKMHVDRRIEVNFEGCGRSCAAATVLPAAVLPSSSVSGRTISDADSSLRTRRNLSRPANTPVGIFGAARGAKQAGSHANRVVVDEEGQMGHLTTTSQADEGGLLYAVLHCNRAACLMAVGVRPGSGPSKKTIQSPTWFRRWSRQEPTGQHFAITTVVSNQFILYLIGD
jgi:hypothetical protein